MEIIIPPDFFTSINNCHLLLDTNVFIDTLLNPTRFGDFFILLKEHNVTLVTIEPVIFEFLKGAQNIEKTQERETVIDSIIETIIPIPKEAFQNAKKLLLEYKEEGSKISITDLLLGTTLSGYHGKLFLMTKNTTDFPTNIFKLETFINLLHRKSIQSYGVYSYSEN